jgi:O-antigen/teichoic acid export membrane protein
MTRRLVLRGGTLVIASTLVWHVSNFLFNSVAARLLGPAHYGSLAAVVAILYVISPVFVSMQTVASRLTTTLGTDGQWSRVRGLLSFYSVRIGGVFAGLSIVFVLLSGALAEFLNVTSPGAVAILGAAFVTSVFTHMQRGVLQGAREFGRYALSTLVEALVKIVAAVVILVFLWRSVGGGVLAIVVSSAVGALANWRLLAFMPKPREQVEQIPHPYRYSLATLGSLVLLALLLSADVLAAKRYLPAHEAGVYAAVSLCGKIVFFATSAITLFLFPFFSARQDQGRDARGPLAAALGVVSLMALCVVGVYVVAPSVVVVPLFGSDYGDANPYLAVSGLAFGCYAIVYLSAMFLLSQQDGRGPVVLGVALIAQLAGLYVFHSSIWDIVYVLLAVLVVTAGALAALAVTRPRPAVATTALAEAP